MADTKRNDDKAKKSASTSGNHEESMKDADKDDYHNPRTSGTTGLTNEDPESESATKKEDAN